MIPEFATLENQVSRIDQQLLYYLIIEQRETNRLLQLLVGQEPKAEKPSEVSALKRPQLMKLMAKTSAPQGWNKWSNEQMIDHLKGAS